MSSSASPWTQHSRSSALHYLPEFAQIHVHWAGDAIQPSHPLPPPSPFAFNLSSASGSFPMSQLFASSGQSFSISPSNEYWGWVSSRIYWFDLLAVQGALKSLLQHHNSKTSILLHSSSLWSNSHIHRKTISIETSVENHKNIIRKTITLTIRTFSLLVFTNMTGKQWSWIFIC